MVFLITSGTVKERSAVINEGVERSKAVIAFKSIFLVAFAFTYVYIKLVYDIIN